MPARSRDSSRLFRTFLRRHTIATLPQLQQVLGQVSRRTVFRHLKALAQTVSYSHAGRYYALQDSARFDATGLWTCGSARFSRQGSLLATAEALVRAAPTGCVAAELDAHLGVRSAGALRTLVGAGRLSRANVGGRFLYGTPEPDRKTAQLTACRLVLAPPRRALPAPTLRDLPTPWSAPVVLFVSLLNEPQRRLFAGLESLRYGPGGDSQTGAALGLDRGIVARGRHKLLARDVQRGRRPGGGRKALEKNPALTARLQELLAPDTACDPEGQGLNWCRRTPGKLAEALRADRQTISAGTVGHLLEARGYSLRVNRQALASTSHPLRDDQFQPSARLRAQCQMAGTPIVSVDAKKKELIGRCRNVGAKWYCAPEEVLDHDFPSDAAGRAMPYGILDLQANLGFVGVGASADTPTFAVDCPALWGHPIGCRRYPHSPTLTILAESGGSHGYCPRAWKHALQHRLCHPYGLTVTVVYYPSGCSQWNPVEHQLFSFISRNWAGRPLDSFETVLNSIRTTTTRPGLRVEAALLPDTYPTGIRIVEEAMQQLQLFLADDLPAWSYTIQPSPAATS